MAKWVVANKKADFEKIASKYGIDKVVARIIRNRDIISDEDIYKYVHGDIGSLYSPHLLMGMEDAIDIVLEKIDEGMHIRVVGDYDADGVCATYILTKGLEHLGAIVDYKIPDRVIDGYGINENIVKDAYDDGIDTIITCDNGISAHEALGLAKDLGMTIVVTDHHKLSYHELESGDIEYILPPHDALVNPSNPDCTYPFKGICGAMVAYKLILALSEVIDFNEDLNRELLEVAGFATVCDVMELVDENRAIVKFCIQSIASPANLGLKSLIEANQLNIKNIKAYHIGYILGPCINAAGRLETADKALSLLFCDSKLDADRIAYELVDINAKRKKVTSDGLEEALCTISDNGFDKDKIIVVHIPMCHESLAGIIAGRICERYNRPSIVITGNGDIAKGSARSIESYNIYEALCKVDNILIKYGGHKQAAGLSILTSRIDDFRVMLNKQCELMDSDLERKIVIDVPMPPNYITEELVSSFEVLEPFGVGNRKPVFAFSHLRLVSGTKLGDGGQVGKYILEDDQGISHIGMIFQSVDQFDNCIKEAYGGRVLRDVYDKSLSRGDGNLEPKIYIDIVYYPNINSYNNRNTIQLVISDYRISTRIAKC